MTDLAELFARDPLDLSKQDLETIIAEMRAKRKQFNLGNASAGSMKPPTAKQREAIDLSAKLGLKLDL